MSFHCANNCIGDLYYLSEPISNPYAHMCWSKEQHVSKRDIRLIGALYPKIRQTPLFWKRLGKATVMRRQYLAKRKEEHERQQHASTTTREDQRSTAQVHQQEAEPELATESPESPDKLADSDTTAEEKPSLLSALRISELKIPSELEEASKDDSDGPPLPASLRDDADTGRSRVPEMPEEAETGQPFECPHCHKLQQFRNGLEWKYVASRP